MKQRAAFCSKVNASAPINKQIIVSTERPVCEYWLLRQQSIDVLVIADFPAKPAEVLIKIREYIKDCMRTTFAHHFKSGDHENIVAKIPKPVISPNQYLHSQKYAINFLIDKMIIKTKTKQMIHLKITENGRIPDSARMR